MRRAPGSKRAARKDAWYPTGGRTWWQATDLRRITKKRTRKITRHSGMLPVGHFLQPSPGGTAKGSLLGSFRWAGGVHYGLSRQSHAEAEEGPAFCSYSRFYPGSLWSQRGADFSPVCELIFRRMRKHGLDWEYVHRHYFSAIRVQASVSHGNYQSVLRQLEILHPRS